MFLVATVDQNWAIGKNGDILYPLPINQAYFNEITKKHIIVYGRKTIPYAEEYFDANQKRVILTRNTSFTRDNATIIHSIAELEVFPSDDLYIVGGASVFEQLYEQCRYAVITRVETVTLNSDLFFPRIDHLDNWVPIEQTHIMHHQGLPFRFVTYRNTDLD